jgi:hypothetical protein
MKDEKIKEYFKEINNPQRDAFLELCTEVDKDLQQGNEVDAIVDTLMEYGSDVYSARLFTSIVEELSKKNSGLWGGWPDWIGSVAGDIERCFAIKDKDRNENSTNPETILWENWPKWAGDYACIVIYGMSKEKLLNYLQLTSVSAVSLAVVYGIYGFALSDHVSFVCIALVLVGILGIISAVFDCCKYRQGTWPRLPLCKR